MDILINVIIDIRNKSLQNLVVHYTEEFWFIDSSFQ